MIVINGEIWRILLVPPNHPQLRRTDGSLTIGACNTWLKTIYISNELSHDFTENVLAHELTHAVLYSYNRKFSSDEEELIAQIVANTK